MVRINDGPYLENVAANREIVEEYAAWESIRGSMAKDE